MSLQTKIAKCQRCGKYKRRLFNVEGMLICADCLRGEAFYSVFREGFRDPELRGDIITVGIDIGNIVWLNPFAQAWMYPLLLWMYFKTMGQTITLDSLKLSWRYKTPLDTVLRVYQEEGILRIVEEGNKHTIVEGDALKEMLSKYGDRPDVFDIVGAWVYGLVISRLHAESDAPDFRAVNAIVHAIAERLVDTDGNIVGEPYVKVVGYSCTKCGARFMTREEAKRHVVVTHRVPSDEAMMLIKEEHITVGYLLDYDYFVETLRSFGVRPEKFIERMLKLKILTHDDPDEPKIVERDGKRYIVVEPAWPRVVARVRVRERELIRSYERTR